MKTVKVNKADLSAILIKNRDGHRENFNKAFEGYRQECIRVLEENLKLLRDGKNQAVRFHEQAPEDHTEDYNRVIAMLEMSVESIVELTDRDFARYVQDDWDWKHAWAVSNSKYTGSAD